MVNLESWLIEYGKSHQHPTNRAIHKVAVPLIMLSVIGLLWSVSWIISCALVIFAIAFYFWLSIPMGFAMLLISAAALGIVNLVDSRIGIPLWLICTVIFVVSWILQFIGHAVERKRPSFLNDLVFLLIGPAWVIAPILKGFGIKL